MTLTRFLSAAAFILASGVSATFASIQINTTRVIYHGAEKDVSIHIMNPGKYPVLLQSWTDDGHQDISPDTMRTPFILTPPLTRVNADAGQTLRLSYTGTPLPQDRESVYWLNVLEIPPVGEKGNNQVQVAFRSRIKLFFRPESLSDKGALSAISQLRWHGEGNNITLSNPTAYHVSVVGITLMHGSKKTTVPANMVAPHSSVNIKLPSGVVSDSADSLTVDAINDYGSSVTEPVSQL